MAYVDTLYGDWPFNEDPSGEGPHDDELSWANEDIAIEGRILDSPEQSAKIEIDDSERCYGVSSEFGARGEWLEVD